MTADRRKFLRIDIVQRAKPREFDVRPSRLHGFGVFASMSFDKDEIIAPVHLDQSRPYSVAEFRGGPPITAVRTSDGRVAPVVGGFPLWYVNSSDHPNVYLRKAGNAFYVVAGAAVRQDDELTVGTQLPWKV